MFKTLFVICVLFGTVNLSDVSFYETLGISKHSTAREIRQAYKKLAIKYHPDKNEAESDQEKFLKITEAYETLKDPQKRRMYDTFGVHQQDSWHNDFHSQEEYDNMIHEGLYSKDPYVESLSAKEFYNYLSDGFHFINFYSPFCPPCQKLADHWKKLAKVYKGIVKVAAVNCKMHNSFCFNTMNIDGYPTLLFYRDGKQGSYIPYDGPRTFDQLEEFVLSYIGRTVSVPTLTYLESLDKPMAYVLHRYRIEPDALLRLAYHLKDLVTIAVIEDDTLIRSNITTQDRTTVVYKYGKTVKEIKSTDEKKVLSKLVKALPAIESVDPDKFKQIRNDLRNGYPNAWVLYFSSKKENKLLLHQMKMKFPEMHFGEVNCSAWSQLCLSLQVEDTPAWAMLKPGGAYHKAPPSADLNTFLRNAPVATKLQSLEPSALETLHKDVGTWVVLVVPYKSSWDAIGEEFTRASLRFHDSKHISFGIVTCTEKTAFYCRDVSFKPVILMQTGDKRDTYTEDIDENEIVDFIHLVMDSAGLELTEQQAMEIMDPSREQTWLVAYLPHGFEDYKREWRLIAKQLRPLQFVRVGVLQCARGAAGFCANVRAPTARLYPVASGQHHTVNLQNLKDAPLVLEWALEYIDDSVYKLNGNSFAKRVLVVELQPTSGTKPWLIYFHSPRCYSCYQKYPDFAIAGILLNNAVNLGKVNCLNDRGVCQQEQIERYPSLRLYLNRNHRQSFSSVIPIQIEDYNTILENVKSHLMKYDESLLAGIHVELKHDEL